MELGNAEQVEEIQNWIENVAPEERTSRLLHIAHLLSFASVDAVQNRSRIGETFNEIYDFLNIIFEHTVTNEVYSPSLRGHLMDAGLASDLIKLETEELFPFEFAYRVQGYLELSGSHGLLPRQVELIAQWADHVYREESHILEIKSILESRIHTADLDGITEDIKSHLMECFRYHIDPSYDGDQELFHRIHAGLPL